ncbi:MAG: hypothetical protein Q4C87_12865 [Actinomycetaceae bacterium]|nr:hypothetical protein [Actinomycetaceae bacterium]
MSSGRNRTSRKSSWASMTVHGAHKRTPDGRKLTAEEKDSWKILGAINGDLQAATRAVAEVAQCPDTVWVLEQFLDPVTLSKKKALKTPGKDLIARAIARIEDISAGITPGSAGAHLFPKKKLAAALQEWEEAIIRRRNDPRWKNVSGTPVTLHDLRQWQDRVTSMDLEVIPHLDVNAEFQRTLDIASQWDEVLARRGHIGERFSLLQEVLQLHNWPGDQWDAGDDYARAQSRYHRRLRKAREIGKDRVRDRIMQRALYLREGLLLDPVDDLEWFLAVCHFRWATPESLDIRPELTSWQLLEWVANLGRGDTSPYLTDIPQWVWNARDPRDIPTDLLTAVSGPPMMIDVDEDVVTALPPGCTIYRLIVSARGPLGPDWLVYWVESEWDDSRPILDLVESAKLHPDVVFISDWEPSDLADLIGPYLGDAFVIPTHQLVAYSHTPGIDGEFDNDSDTLPDRFDAGV